VVMRERNAAGRQERRRRRRNGGRSTEARRRKRPMEERRTFRYRSPPHNRTSVTEGAIPDHLVSLHRGRPGHLAVTSAVRSSSLFSSLSVTSLFLFLSLIFSLSLSRLLGPSESIKSHNSQIAHLTVCISTRYVRKRQTDREKERERENYILSMITFSGSSKYLLGQPISYAQDPFLSCEQYFCVRVTIRCDISIASQS